MIRLRAGLLLACVACAGTPARAEHRAALIIANSEYREDSLSAPARDAKALSARLARLGFRCTVKENLEDPDIKSAVEGFAGRTPTMGTALLVFCGEVRHSNYKGHKGACLMGINARSDRGGISVALALEWMSERGGSARNLVLLDAPNPPEESGFELPVDCLLAWGDVGGIGGEGDLVETLRSKCDRVHARLAAGTRVEGAGSSAVSPPHAFVRGKRAGDEWVNQRGMVFCWCPPGRFVMGSAPDEPGRYADEAQREVAITNGFWIGKYELTLRENLRNRPHRTTATHKNHPINMLHQDDGRTVLIRTYTSEERKAGRLPPDWQYSLPTDAQWEYAARAGTSGTWYFGDDVNDLPAHANFSDRNHFESGDIYANSASRTLDDGVAQLAVVGSYAPNPWGLHDVHGNVSEWCLGGGARGGSWISPPANTRAAYRVVYSSRNEQTYLGYRVVIQVEPPPPPPKKGGRK